MKYSYTIIFIILLLGCKAGETPVSDKMLGADISFLPELESQGKKFIDHGTPIDGVHLLKKYKFNYVRLRIFHTPQADSGYSKQGFCGLEETLKMAKRIKEANLKFLLDFHYSDNWADPGKQWKPHAWKNISFDVLKDSVYRYTKKVITALSNQNTLPDMVQIGNEINHGMIWPDGATDKFDQLAELVKSGVAGVKEVSSSPKIMIHIACGGQNDESRYLLDNFLSRGVTFDIIGQSYYPQWHGTLSDLKNNLTDLTTRYSQNIILVEYSEHKQEVNDIVFNLPLGKGKGTAIWEPLNTWETFIDKDGNTIPSKIDMYPALASKYGIF